jgi:hypothetical protein
MRRGGRLDLEGALGSVPLPNGAVAQLGERCNRTAEVRGSNPLGSTKKIKDLEGFWGVVENAKHPPWSNQAGNQRHPGEPGPDHEAAIRDARALQAASGFRIEPQMSAEARGGAACRRCAEAVRLVWSALCSLASFADPMKHADVA